MDSGFPNSRFMSDDDDDDDAICFLNTQFLSSQGALLLQAENRLLAMAQGATKVCFRVFSFCLFMFISKVLTNLRTFRNKTAPKLGRCDSVAISEI